MSCIYADRPYTGRIPTCEAGYFNCPNSPTCEEYTEYKPPTNADRIRAMSDEELADLLCTADWCEACDQLRDNGTCQAMEAGGPLNKHCVAAGLRWLRQPADK